jgi:hypothetical protein
MSTEKEIVFSNEGGNIPLKLVKCFEKDFDNQEMLDNKWLFPRASDHLGTVLRPGVVRPLSPTFKVHSPENVFPGMTVLCEGFDEMREWKKTIEFVGFFARKGNMFNSRHHWDMRTKFLDVRLRCMEKIIENPSSTHRKPEGGFFVRTPVAVQKALEEEKRKIALAREREICEESGTEMDGEYCDELILENHDILSPKRSMLREQHRVQKENIFEQVEKGAEDEKLQRESLQIGLNIEIWPESEYSLPALYNAERKHYSSNNDCTQDLVVVGKSIQLKSSFTTCLTQDSTSSADSEMETENVMKGFASELVLEDINDFLPGVILPSCKPKYTELENSTSIKAATTADVSNSEMSGNVAKQQTVDGAQLQRSRLQRLRRSIRSLFSCFRRNQVTPVDI